MVMSLRIHNARIHHAVRSLYVIALLSGSLDQAYGKLADTAPEAKDWSSSLDISGIKDVTFPRKVLILQSLEKPIPTAISFKEDLCEENSFLICANAESFDYTLKINKLPSEPKPADFMKYSGANVILFNSGAGIDLVVGKKPEKINFSKAGKLNGKLNPVKILKRLFVVLGYDGVVLAQKGSFILVGSLKSSLNKEHLQGMLLENSSDEWIIEGKSKSTASVKKSGAALLQLDNAYGGFGVFRLIAQKTDAVAKIGQKVILEHYQDIPKNLNLDPTLEN